jgi:hypothetical protein
MCTEQYTALKVIMHIIADSQEVTALVGDGLKTFYENFIL